MVHSMWVCPLPPQLTAHIIALALCVSSWATRQPPKHSLCQSVWNETYLPPDYRTFSEDISLSSAVVYQQLKKLVVPWISSGTVLEELPPSPPIIFPSFPSRTWLSPPQNAAQPLKTKCILIEPSQSHLTECAIAFDPGLSRPTSVLATQGFWFMCEAVYSSNIYSITTLDPA